MTQGSAGAGRGGDPAVTALALRRPFMLAAPLFLVAALSLTLNFSEVEAPLALGLILGAVALGVGWGILLPPRKEPAGPWSELVAAALAAGPVIFVVTIDDPGVAFFYLGLLAALVSAYFFVLGFVATYNRENGIPDNDEEAI